MMLENSFSATETTDGSDDNDYLDKNETISPQKPRKLRMMERTKNRWHHRSVNPVESKKASVSVQLEEVDKIIELLEYRSILEDKEDCSGEVDMGPVASTSKDSTILPQAITKENKYRRIRLFDGSSSSSDTDADKNESSGPKERPVETIVDDDSPQSQGSTNVVRTNSVSLESSKDLGHHSYKRSKSHNDKAPPYHHGKHSSSGSSHHHKKHSIIDESHHARSSKTRIEDAADVFPIIKK